MTQPTRPTPPTQQPPSPLELHLAIESEVAAVVRLAEASGLSKRSLKTAMNKGAVWLTRGSNTRRLRRGSAQLRAGDTLHLYYDERVLRAEPPQPLLIADEGSYSVWAKPFGMLSQGSKWGDHCTLARWCEQHLKPQRPAFTVHRLDRAATGVMAIAHTKKCARALSRAFEHREVQKLYFAIVHGAFPCEPKVTAIESPIDGRAARSVASSLAHNPKVDRTLVEVRIETGRKHQIRRHLSGLGFPIVGDRRYGTRGDTEDLQLASCELTLPCPGTNEPKRYTLPERLRPRLE